LGLLDRLAAGDLSALARLATYVENSEPLGVAAIDRLYAQTGRAYVVGLTGPPGAGKSSLLDRLIDAWRARGRRVAVIAVDPSSPLSGGATLGDRIRIRERPEDPGVFVRSMASRGRYGGLAPATAGMIHLMDAAGFDIVLVETVGVGQEEVDIAGLAHVTALLQIPGGGDGVQMLKAGLLEVADLYVVNKADLPGADMLSRELAAVATLSLSHAGADHKPPVLKVSALTGDGIDALVDTLDALRPAGEADSARRRVIAQAEIGALIQDHLRRQLADAQAHPELLRLIDDAAARRQTPRAAAIGALHALGFGPGPLD
jgi:LAO/AO transport system kinase